MTDSFRKQTDDFLREKPCLAVLTSILSVILPVIILPDCVWIGILLPLLFIFAGWFLLGTENAIFRIVLPAIAATVSLLCCTHIRSHDPLSEILHYRTAASAEAEVMTCDPLLCDSETGLSDPSRVRCRILRLRFSADDFWHDVSGTVIARFPAGTPTLSYGEIFKTKGIFRLPDSPLLPGAFDYQEYLSRHGIRYSFLIDDAVHTGSRISWYGILLKGRNRLLRSMLNGISDEQDRSLAAALLFGCRQGMEPGTKADFIRSGTIHILTVSGLHVGIFAGAVFLLLTFIPFRLRMLLTPLITLLYVLMTGIQVPAIRALMMLICWCVPRAFLLRGGGLNPIFLAASLLLLWNPYQIADAGFQYSFLCVIFLVMAAPKAGEWISMIYETRQWIPDKKKTWRDHFIMKLRFKAGMTLAGGLTAWLCASILTLYYQGICVPFALPANLIIMPVVSLVFFIFTVCMIPCLVFPDTGIFAGMILAKPIGFIEPVCAFFGNLYDGTIPIPAVWSIPAGITALLLTFSKTGRKAGIAGLLVFISLVFCWCSAVMPEPELAILYGGSHQIPEIIISIPEDHFVLTANLPDYRSAVHTADYLKRRGHSSISFLMASANTRDHIGGTQFLLDMMPVDILLLPDTNRSVRVGETLIRAKERQTQVIRGYSADSGNSSVKIITEKERFSFDILQKCRKIYIQIESRGNNGTKLEISCGNGFRKSYLLPHQQETGMIRLSLQHRKESI